MWYLPSTRSISIFSILIWPKRLCYALTPKAISYWELRCTHDYSVYSTTSFLLAFKDQKSTRVKFNVTKRVIDESKMIKSWWIYIFTMNHLAEFGLINQCCPLGILHHQSLLLFLFNDPYSFQSYFFRFCFCSFSWALVLFALIFNGCKIIFNHHVSRFL